MNVHKFAKGRISLVFVNGLNKKQLCTGLLYSLPNHILLAIIVTMLIMGLIAKHYVLAYTPKVKCVKYAMRSVYRRSAHLPSLQALSPYKPLKSVTNVAWPVRLYTHGYLPSLGASPTRDQYQICCTTCVRVLYMVEVILQLWHLVHYPEI